MNFYRYTVAHKSSDAPAVDDDPQHVREGIATCPGQGGALQVDP
jgi:hypothetical protein